MSGEPAYREELPEGCPPDDATDIVGETVVYRMLDSNPATDKDFDSWRTLNPDSECPDGVCECRARGVSVRNEEAASRRLQKLPKFKNCFIGKLTLDVGAGKIKKTGGRAHYDWWPFANYDILAVCEVVS